MKVRRGTSIHDCTYLPVDIQKEIQNEISFSQRTSDDRFAPGTASVYKMRLRADPHRW